MFIATVILSVLLGIGFALASLPKVSAADNMVAELARLGVSTGLVRLIGALEFLGAAGLVIGLWIGPLGIAAAAGLVLLMAGAVISHLKAHDSAKKTVPSLVLLLLSAAALVLRAASL